MIDGRDFENQISRQQGNKMWVPLHRLTFGDGFYAQRPFKDTPIR